jgi:hypothetical protein
MDLEEKNWRTSKKGQMHRLRPNGPTCVDKLDLKKNNSCKGQTTIFFLEKKKTDHLLLIIQSP